MNIVMCYGKYYQILKQKMSCSFIANFVKKKKKYTKSVLGFFAQELSTGTMFGQGINGKRQY